MSRWIICLLLLLTACTPRNNAPLTEIRAEFSAAGLTPLSWRVTAGQEIPLTLSNQTPDTHVWVVLSRPLTPPFSADDEAQVLYRIEIPAGQTVTARFTPPLAPGEYTVVFSYTTDEEAEPQGRLVVLQPGYPK
jgi:hypothetical protein